MNRTALAHKGAAVAIAAAVPLAVYLVDGSVEEFAFPLGAVLGFCYWYFLDPLP